MYWSRYEEQETGDHIIVAHVEDGVVMEPSVVVRVEHAEEDGVDKRADLAYLIVRYLSAPQAQ